MPSLPYPSEGEPPRPLRVVRKEAVARLEHGYAEDLLSVEEFETRLEQVYAATTVAAIADVVCDLPLVPPPSTDSAYSGGWTIGDRVGDADGTPSAQPARPSPFREDDSIITFMGDVTRRGAWHPARTTKVVTLMGDVRLDYSDVAFSRDDVEVRMFSLLGDLEITVPPGVNVEVEGAPLLGDIDDRVGSAYPDAPTIVVRGFMVLGDLTIKPPRGKKKRRWFS